MIRVLIIEDSPTIHQMLDHFLSADPGIEVIGWARDGAQGVEMAAKLRPDLITTDIQMPRMDGLEATRRIMEEAPTPLLVISAFINDKEMNVTFNALKFGALEVIEKPSAEDGRTLAEFGVRLVKLVKTLAGVKVVRRYTPRSAPRPVARSGVPQPFTPVGERAEAAAAGARIIAVGASTGGPQALEFIAKQLPAEFPHPILVVQHMTEGFIDGFANWLAGQCALRVRVARSMEPIQRGITFAPDNKHLLVGENDRLLISTADPVGGHRPSVDTLFESMAQRYRRRAVGVLLTGMGRDGASGMESLYTAGALTIAQDETTSTVFGMPKEAIQRCAARWIMPLGALAESLAALPLGPLELPQPPIGR